MNNSLLLWRTGVSGCKEPNGAESPTTASARSGFFRVAERNGVFWLVDPDGGRFISKGVNTVRFDQDHVGNTRSRTLCRRLPGEIWYAAHLARCDSGPTGELEIQHARLLVR